MTLAFFSDLDGTLVYSRRRVAGQGRTDLISVERRGGHDTGYMTLAAVKSLASLSQVLEFVPTTTRNLAQYQRLSLPHAKIRYAITDSGARIHVDGVEDQAWTRYMSSLTRASAPAATVAEELRRQTHGASWLKAVRSSTMFAVCVIAKEHAVVPHSFRSILRDCAADWAYTVSVQGARTYLIPRSITKERAAAEVASWLGPTLTVAAGDSQLDLNLLRFADRAVQPQHGELFGHGISRTSRSGVDAAAEILEFVATYA